MPRLGSVPALALLATLVVAAVAVGGTLSLRETATFTPATKVPVTLSSTYTVIPAPSTAATISGVGLPLGGLTPTTVMTLQHDTIPWSVKLVATAKSGFGALDSVTLALVGATTSSITLTSGSAVPATTSAVALGTTSDATVTARGTCVATCTITLQLQFTSASAGARPLVVYPVTLTVD
jgi:hypothetical protein